MRKKRILAIGCILGILILTCSISQAKYVLYSDVIAARLEIDRTKPIGIVNYSTQEMTTEDVEVVVNLSEPINKVDGWELSEDGLTMNKIYKQNNTEVITIVDLSGNENWVKINVQNIDRNKPVISLVSIQNSNIDYLNYAKNTHIITAKIKITDMKINSNIDESKIDIIVNSNTNICTKKVENLEKAYEEITFDLLIQNIEGNGLLKIKIPSQFVTDMAGNSSEEIVFDTDINIDNIKPEGNYSQEVLQNGKVRAKIDTSEEIRSLDGWSTTDKRIFIKDFPANVSYITKITDYAGNEAEVEVNVTSATYIVLTYASHNSEVGWTYGLGNYDIAGGEAVKKNPKYKTEALAFRITGGVSTSFVKIRAYVHTFWNNLSNYGKCVDTGYKYKIGETEDMTMDFERLSTIEGKKYMQCGGSGINRPYEPDYDGNNPITTDAVGHPSYTYPYGVSEILMDLQDYSELSIVYQILVNGKGWLNVATNGEVTTAGRELPMSAIREAIIPNSEKEDLMSLWNKDIGTYNVN